MRKVSKITELNKLVPLAKDADKHQFPERYALLYYELLNNDNCSVVVPFYIQDLKNALEKLDKNEKEKIVKVFGLNGSTIHILRTLNSKDIALQNMLDENEKVMSKLRSLEMMYIYAPKVKKAIDLSAKKVWDPDGRYDIFTKAKYLNIYYVFLMRYHRFPLDQEEYKPTQESVMIEKRSFLLPYLIVEAYNTLFKEFNDGDILIPMIDAFLNNVDNELKEEIYDIAQLTSDRYTYKLIKEYREMKEKLFPNSSWRTGINFFRLSSIQKSASPSRIKKGIDAYRRFTKKQETLPYQYEKQYYGTKQKDIKVYEIYKNFYISDLNELKQYFNLFEFLEKQMPELPLGRNQIRFCDSCLVK